MSPTKIWQESKVVPAGAAGSTQLKTHKNVISLQTFYERIIFLLGIGFVLVFNAPVCTVFSAPKAAVE